MRLRLEKFALQKTDLNQQSIFPLCTPSVSANVGRKKNRYFLILKSCSQFFFVDLHIYKFDDLQFRHYLALRRSFSLVVIVVVVFHFLVWVQFPPTSRGCQSSRAAGAPENCSFLFSK